MFGFCYFHYYLSNIDILTRLFTFNFYLLFKRLLFLFLIFKFFGHFYSQYIKVNTFDIKLSLFYLFFLNIYKVIKLKYNSYPI